MNQLAQSTYQVRLGWGVGAFTKLAPSEIMIVIDVLGEPEPLATAAAALPHTPTVLIGSLRNATATARAAYDEQLRRGGRTSMNLVLAGTAPSSEVSEFAVEDYLAAGAIADALTELGIDHSAPDVAVAAEGFRALRRAVKHLVSASGSALAATAVGEGETVRNAAQLDAEACAIHFAD